MTKRSEAFEQFQQELQTVPIEDYTPAVEGTTKHPFNSNIYPQGSIHPKHNNPYTHAKFKYIERYTHGRSIDEIASSGKVIWGGKYPCDIFGGRDLKGSRHEYAFINVGERGPNSKYSHIYASGLYDETNVEYLIKASELLRSNGIPTENITNIYEIHQVVHEGKLMSLEEWRTLNIRVYAERLLGEGDGDDKNPSVFKKIVDFANNTKFYQVERELQVSERVRDLAKCKTEKDFKSILGTPLKWLNAATKAKGEGIIPGTEQPEPFDINQKEDVKRYLEEWLPSQMGIYLGRLRKAGLKNDFGHAQQWSLAATMYDGQSYVGENLNGKKLTEADYAASLQEALGVLEELFDGSSDSYIKQNYGDSLDKAKETLLTNYFNEINYDYAKHIESYGYLKLSDNSFYNGQQRFIRDLKPEIYIKVLKKFGVDLTVAEDVETKTD